MKRLIAALAAVTLPAVALFAQNFATAPGYAAPLAFSDADGFNIGALGTDSTGNVYYLETGDYGTGVITQLLKRNTANLLAAPSTLFSYSGSVYPDFVKISGGSAYLGESTTNTIKSVNVSSGISGNVVTLPRNYDLAFRGSEAFVDAADASFQNNKVFKLNLGTGALTHVLTTGDASGPLAFTAAGDLIYGYSGYPVSASSGIYRFSKTKVDNVLNATTGPLTLGDGERLFDNIGSQYLALIDDRFLYQAYTNYSNGVNLLRRYDLLTMTESLVGQIGVSDIFSGLATSPAGLLVAVSAQYGGGPSSVFLVNAVPEPSSLLLTSIAGAWLLGRRGQRSRHAG